MTRLLVSVRDRDEAERALAGGADWIDLKDPSRGALGACDPVRWSEVASLCGTRLPLSVALGELFGPGRVVPSPSQWTGIQYAKLGLAGALHQAAWVERWRRRLAELPESVQPVAVAYADHQAAEAPAVDDVLRVGLELGCSALLIDTFHKRGGDLFAYAGDRQLAKWVAAARGAGLLVVLGGSLDLPRLGRALELQPDLIAVRGAACCEGRQSVIDTTRVRRLAVLIHDQAQPQGQSSCAEVL